MPLLNATHIVEILSPKVWWPNNIEKDIFFRAEWMTFFYLSLLAILLYGIWWIIFVPINWTRVSYILAYLFFYLLLYIDFFFMSC